ncbi:MAG: response regulator [Gemmatimonadales bacterium]|nr:response regulator [Gemmatimonadota bacterium]MDX2059997.1 response regulator [Gemmatimonadales bacterium]
MRALIVDDSRAMRTMLGRMMAEFGFEILQAGHGKEALAVLEANGRPDVMLLDWNMPEMNGFELLVTVRGDARWSDLPIIMVTTETEMAQVAKAIEHGVNEYVMKPFTKDVLLSKLELLGLVAA